MIFLSTCIPRRTCCPTIVFTNISSIFLSNFSQKNTKALTIMNRDKLNLFVSSELSKKIAESKERKYRFFSSQLLFVRETALRNSFLLSVGAKILLLFRVKTRTRIIAKAFVCINLELSYDVVQKVVFWRWNGKSMEWKLLEHRYICIFSITRVTRLSCFVWCLRDKKSHVAINGKYF